MTPGGPEWRREMLRQATENAAYLQEEWEQLKAQYPEQWVAIQKKRVRAHAETVDSLLDALAAEGVDPAWTTVQLITDEPRRLMS